MTDAAAVSPAEWRPQAGWIDAGRWRQAAATIEVRDQQSGETLAEVAAVDDRDGERVVSETAERFAREPVLPVHRRRAILRGAAAQIGEQSESFARLLCAEGSKTISEARAEVRRCVRTLDLCAEEATRNQGETIAFDAVPHASGYVGGWRPVPLGVIVAVTPFNDAINLVAHKIGPALAAGNAVIVKPSSHTPLSALRLAGTLLEQGLPPWMISVLPGGPELVRAMVEHSGTTAVSFTGGWTAGQIVARLAGPRRTLMELGANCATIVLADADREDAAERIVAGAFSAAGQNCLSVQRVYVERAIQAELIERVGAGARALRCGDKHAEETEMGPLIDAAAADRVEAWVGEAIGSGAMLLTAGGREGPLLQPTVLADVPERSRVMCEEVFGPVVSVNAVDSVEEAVERANDTPFGLQAGLFTASVDRALAMASRLRVGGVLVNDTSDFRIDEMPFGGFGRSGVGREGVRFAVKALSEPKLIAIRGRA